MVCSVIMTATHVKPRLLLIEESVPIAVSVVILSLICSSGVSWVLSIITPSFCESRPSVLTQLDTTMSNHVGFRCLLSFFQCEAILFEAYHTGGVSGVYGEIVLPRALNQYRASVNRNYYRSRNENRTGTG